MANDFRLHNGTYLGQVIDNNDPDNINRLLVKVPELDPNGSMYFRAMPKGMMAGKDFGFNFVPGKGDYVYISFRLGLLDYPLWEPGYWAIGEKPEEFNKDMVGYKFRDGSVLSYDEKESEFTLLLKSGDYVVFRDNSFTIAINNGPYIKVEDESISMASNSREFRVTPDGIKVKNLLGEDYVAKAEEVISGLVTSNKALLAFLTTFVASIESVGLIDAKRTILTTALEVLDNTIGSDITFQPIKTT